MISSTGRTTPSSLTEGLNGRLSRTRDNNGRKVNIFLCFRNE